jgi:hypothetical protein
MNEHHFIAEAGLYGCLPNYCQFHDTYQAAVDDLAALHELGRDRKRILKRDGYLDLNISRGTATSMQRLSLATAAISNSTRSFQSGRHPRYEPLLLRLP